MTRKRLFNPNSYYHVIMRGNNRRAIFNNRDDMIELLRAFNHTHHKHPFDILAFCFMTNHYHILIKANNLSKIMSLVNRRYSDSYKVRYNHIGRIYQKRFYAKEVSSALGLLAVSTYIHRNPIETVVPMVTHLKDYPYSSFPLYCHESKKAPAFLNRNLLKTLLPPDYDETNQAYAKYCLEVQVGVEEDVVH